jgi:hypothetical protein
MKNLNSHTVKLKEHKMQSQLPKIIIKEVRQDEKLFPDLAENRRRRELLLEVINYNNRK